MTKQLIKKNKNIKKNSVQTLKMKMLAIQATVDDKIDNIFIFLG